MDRNVTVRFYQVVPETDRGHGFDQVLMSINEREKSQRENEVAEGCNVRLEYLYEADGLVVGDMTRVQDENLPPEVTDEDTQPLAAERIGQVIAFCYDPETRIIAVQFDQRAVSPGRFMSYVSHFGRPARFGYLPVLRQDAWDLFTGETTKKLTLQVARMENFENVERTQGSFEDQMIDWSEFFGAPTIEITLRARGRDGHLNNDEAQGTIQRFINYSQEVMGIKKIQAETVEGDEPYNFLQQLLQEKSTLVLPANDPAAARNIRMNFVKECYDEHRDHFQQVYVHPAEH